MTERNELLTAVASIIEDYRAGELERPTQLHVDRWISQFDAGVQVPILREMAHVLRQTYFTKERVSGFFQGLIETRALAGEHPCDYWRTVTVLDIQQNGQSQSEIRDLFGVALKKSCGVSLEECGGVGGRFAYLDDVLFSGSRIGNDLTDWIANQAPEMATIEVIVIAAHLFGEWKCSERLKQEAVRAGKKLTFRFWAGLRVENRKAYRNESEVLWPAVIPDDAALAAYMAQEAKFPFEPRSAGGRLEHPFFSSEVGRQLLERELLLAGMRIRALSQNPSHALRPLGFSPFGLGFGSLIVTYRNCPNNTPLALWWGDPAAEPGHPFAGWYPLLPRKTYAPRVAYDAFAI